MRGEDRHKRITEWFSTPHPPQMPDAPRRPGPPWIPDAPRVGCFPRVGIFFLLFCLVAFSGLVLEETNRLWQEPDGTLTGFSDGIIGKLTAHLFSGDIENDESRYGTLQVVFHGCGILSIIMGIWAIGGISTFIKTIKPKREAKARYRQAKAKYEKAKAEHEAAKAKHDALPSSSQMVEWLKEDLELAQESIFRKSELEDEIETDQPLFVWIPEISSGKIERTEHGYFLCSIWKLEALYILEQSVIVGQYTYHWGQDTRVSESTMEHFYRDIMSIDRTSEGLREAIKINMIYREHVQFSAEGHLLVGDQGSEKLSSRMDKAARAIRRLLRDTKNEI